MSLCTVFGHLTIILIYGSYLNCYQKAESAQLYGIIFCAVDWKSHLKRPCSNMSLHMCIIQGRLIAESIQMLRFSIRLIRFLGQFNDKPMHNKKNVWSLFSTDDTGRGKTLIKFWGPSVLFWYNVWPYCPIAQSRLAVIKAETVWRKLRTHPHTGMQTTGP